MPPQRRPSRAHSQASASETSANVTKDEAITLLQEGPRDQFSNVLKAYLTQQSEYGETGLPIGLGAAQSSGQDRTDQYSQPLIFESQFSKAQQLLLQPKGSGRVAPHQAKAAVGTAQLVHAHIQKGAKEQAYFNRKAQQQRAYQGQLTGSGAPSRLAQPSRGMNSTTEMAEAAPAEQLTTLSREAANAPVPASWLPAAQPRLSSNDARSRSFARVSPSSGTATAPFPKEKAATPFLVHERVTSTNQSVLSQSHERQSQGGDPAFKLNKLRNTYKPLI